MLVRFQLGLPYAQIIEHFLCDLRCSILEVSMRRMKKSVIVFIAACFASLSLVNIVLAKDVTITLGGPNAPLLWETARPSGRWAQGATISDKYYIYAQIGKGDVDGKMVIVDR